MPDPPAPPPKGAAGSSRPDKAARPRSVALPSPQYSRNRPHSPVIGPGGGNGGGGGMMSPSPAAGMSSGAMSPSANPNQFVFPIRSVFQGMGDPDQAASRRPTTSKSPGHRDGRRFSDAFAEAADGDVGMQTIHEMLAQSSRSKDTSGAPAVATFSSRAHHSPRASPDPTPRSHEVFFSSSSQHRPGEEPPFFSGGTSASSSAHGSGNASSLGGGGGGGGGVQNDSTTLPGSGLPQPQRAPVGQPQAEPAEANFKHFPAGETSFTAPAKTAEDDAPPPASPPPRDAQPETQAPPLQAPVAVHAPRKPRSGGDSGGSAVEADDEGVFALVNDFAGIVRLGDVGSGGSAGTIASGSAGPKSINQQSSESGPAAGTTEARLARQNRSNARDVTTRRDPVRQFIEEQSHLTHMTDPNAPTPTPPPGEDDDGRSSQSTGRADEGSDCDGTDSSVAAATDGSGASATAESHESSLPGGAEAAPEFVTFRFEHIQTDDGHHVVTGREGKLRSCEEEPITTPGAVQGFGVLIVLDEDYDSGRLVVRQVSENATELLGLSPRYLFQLDCFTKILTADQEDLLRDNIEYLPDPCTGKEDEEGPQVFLLSGFGEPGSDDSEENASDNANRRREWTCWVAAHRPKQPNWNKVDDRGRPVEPPDLIVLEFELEKDFYNPLMQPFEAVSSGTETPDSGSLGTASGGSGQASTGSVPTVGSMTSVPSTSTVHSATPQDAKTITQSSAGRSRRRQEPMGLEGIEIDHPIDRLIESTTNHARPLRALERMRRTGGAGSHAPDSTDSPGTNRPRRQQRVRQPAGATGTMDVFAVLGQINDQLGAANDLETFLKITVGMVQDLCRFHRVLLYQFDESMNGQVVAEIVEWGKTTDLFKGLMFPASDIPAQARELYKINKVRLLYDRSQTTARLVLRSREDLDHPLDMTHCYLRAMSPIHIKYLANMHVRSSMSVSIMAFGQLWGLVACHSYGNQGMRVSFPVRQMMRILSDSISRNIERLSYAQRLHTRKLISTIPTQAHPTGYIVSNADDLLQIFDADAGLLVIGDGCKLLGQSDQGHAMLAIAEYLRIVKFDTLKASNHIAKDLPDLVLPRAADTIAGFLYVPLTAKAGQDFIVFLRKGQVREVQWAGKPYKDEHSGKSASLEPRKSFKIWSEKVTGRARAWSDDQLESAGVLALIYGKFIQVWREKQSAMASNQLTAILLSNTSHAVRTPLSQIINTLELALSGNIDPDVRSMLENSHQASRALLFHVHDLLDLTRIETGNETAFSDPFDLRQTIADATRLYHTETTRRGLEFKLTMADDLPKTVIGDSRKIKTVISNLVANSVKFTRTGFIEVSCHLQRNAGSVSGGVSARGSGAGGADGGAGTAIGEGSVKASSDVEGNNLEIAPQGNVYVEIVVSDTGCGIPSAQLEAMFVTLEGADEIRAEKTGLGLGLAVVARIVEQLNGQLRAESEVERGSRFFFTLPMQVDDGRAESRTRESSLKSGSANSSYEAAGVPWARSPHSAAPKSAASAASGVSGAPGAPGASGASGASVASVARARTSSSGGDSSLSLRSGMSVSELESFVNDFGASHMLAPVGADDPRLREAEERMTRPGTFPVTDSSWPVRPTRVDADSEQSISPPASVSPRIGGGGGRSSLSGGAGSSLSGAGSHSSRPSAARRQSSKSVRQAAVAPTTAKSAPPAETRQPSTASALPAAQAAPATSSSAPPGAQANRKPRSPSPAPARELVASPEPTAPPAPASAPAPAPAPATASAPAPATAPAPAAAADPSPPGPSRSPRRERHDASGKQKLRVLVVEDDLINSQILQKRLRMDKHDVTAVYNGQEAVDLLRHDMDYDALLMDIQMPIMDGRTAAKEIRKLEQATGLDPAIRPMRVDGRIPIFAVSASLYENDRSNLMADFDGWLLKPLDFQRVRKLLTAAEDAESRAAEVYQQGHWERGGYFRAAAIPLAKIEDPIA